MRRLTVKEVNEQFGGKLPPDATFRADNEPDRPAPPPAKPSVVPVGASASPC